MELTKMYLQLICFWLFIGACVTFCLILIVTFFGHPPVKKSTPTKPYEGDKEEIETLLKWDDIDFNNEVNINKL